MAVRHIHGIMGVDDDDEGKRTGFAVAPSPTRDVAHVDPPAAGQARLFPVIGSLLSSTDHAVGGVDIPCDAPPSGRDLPRLISEDGMGATEAIVIRRHCDGSIPGPLNAKSPSIA